MSQSPESAQQWIVIPKWDKFQHYKDRHPVWIKNYTGLLRNDDYRNLTGHQRAVLHGLWLEYASSHRHLALTTRSLSRRLGIRVMTRDLEALNHAGFIEVSASKPASKPLAQRSTYVLQEGASAAQENGAASTTRKSIPPRVCPECGIGGGMHLAECQYVHRKP